MTVATPTAFGTRLRQLREQAGISQYELGKWAGVVSSTINRLESGDRVPSWDMVRRLAAALGISVTAFETPGDAPVIGQPPEPSPPPPPRPLGKRK